MTVDPKSDLLAWTVTDAPGLDELVSTPAPAPIGHFKAQTHEVSRRIGLTTAIVVASLLLGLGLMAARSLYRVTGDVTQIAAHEELAMQAGDTLSIKALDDGSSADWLKTQIQLALNGQAAPLPVGAGLVRPITRPGTIQAVRGFGPDIVQVDVARQYVAPDGTNVTFVLPQFYRLANHAWKRSRPPDAFWGDTQFFVGSQLTIGYYQADSAFVAQLGPELDSAIQQACEAWRCPVSFVFTLMLTNDVPADYVIAAPDQALPRLAPDDPLLFALVLARNYLPPAVKLSLPSPHATGYPADGSSMSLLQRTVALQILTRVARFVTPAQNGVNPADYPLYYALLARQAAELGVESTTVTGIASADTALAPQQFWCLGQPNPDGTSDDHAALRGALALLNRLLAGRPQTSDIEAELWRRLASAHDPITWLADTPGISVEQVQAQLLSIAANATQVAEVPPSHRPVVLGCQDGTTILALWDAHLSNFLYGHYPSAVLDYRILTKLVR